MAPSRRKGGGKAAAVAAACRQWKVGDLVLAKVKGFPAWPATVSEPEKWGYSTDWKKVLVHFFGTQQIAFCNPADVEAFTEEKKQALLTKRHAKGSDFVRAVKEITESYEKLKQLEKAGDPKSAEEATLPSAVNTTLLPQVSETPTVISLTQMKYDPSHCRDELTLLNEDASAAEQMLALRDDSVPRNKSCDSAVAEKPRKIATYTSRRRNGGAGSQEYAPLKVQHSKSSSRLQTHKLQSSMLQYIDDEQSINDVEDGALRRRKRIRRSLGHSESDDVASSALNSHGSDVENASEIATVESDNNTKTEGNDVDSGSKVEQIDIGGQFLEGDCELNKGLNFQINAMVKRKKRKPTRKRGTSDAVDPLSKVEAEAGLEAGACDKVRTSQNSHERFTERPCEENGDEHLPLVKRARVRMSRAFYGSHEGNGSSLVEERSSKDTLVSATTQTSPSDLISSHDTFAVEESRFLAKLSGDMVNVVPSRVEKSYDRMSPSEACVQTVGESEYATGWNELSKAPDDEAAGPQSNQVGSLPADGARTANAPEATCSGDSQPMKLPTSESDLPGLQCCQVTKIETSLDPNTVDSSANKASGDSQPMKLPTSESDLPGLQCCQVIEIETSLDPYTVDSSVNKASGDSQSMKLPTSESDLLGLQCCQVTEIETSLDPNTVDSSANKASEICSSSIPSQLSRQDRSHDLDACDSLDYSREYPNEEGNSNDACVAQVVQSEGVEHSPSPCIMVVKQEIEMMQIADSMVLKAEHVGLSEEYAIAKPAQTTPNPPISTSESDVIVDENVPLHEEGNRNDACVAQVVQSVGVEHSPSTCILVIKQEIEMMQMADNMLLKEEHVGQGEEYAIAKPAQTTPNPPIATSESDVIVDENVSLNETGYNKCDDAVESSRQQKMIGETDKQKQQVLTNNSVAVSENLSREQMSLSPANIADTPARGTPHSNSVYYHISTAESANDMQNSNNCSPNVQSGEKEIVSDAIVKEEEKIETGVCQGQRVVSCDVQSTRESFEDALNSLVRTKESIGRATLLAMDLMKFGVSAKAMEILAHTLESESNLERRVDLFFLVDSIAQCSKGLKGDTGCVYLSAIQVSLPRLLAAAVPAGATTQVNREQCLKVLKLWLERRILPESIVRHHIRELDSHTIVPACLYSRRSARTERSLDDPVRDMENMLVDEYGSNSTLQLPGFCMPALLKDEEGWSESERGSGSEGHSDSDGGEFESVTPEHESRILEENVSSSTAERHTLILEDVDGELEMEDVAPAWETGNCTCTDQADNTKTTDCHLGQQRLPVVGTSHQHVSLSSPPLPSSSPPPPPPPPAPPLQQAQCAISDSFLDGSENGGYRNMHGDHQAGPRMNPQLSVSTMHYQGPELSFSSGVDFTNSIPQAGGSNFQHRPYPSHPHPPPPPPPPLHQYPFTEPGHHTKSRRDAPSYSHRSHYVPNFDERNFHDNHERMRHEAYENRDNWRYPPSSSYGSRFQDKNKAPYPSSSYNGGPSREPGRLQNQRWNHPPRPYNNRHSLQPKLHSEGHVPVGMRDPGTWHQRSD